jgi:hypothetical protein
MSTYWTAQTRYGTFSIIPTSDRFEVRFESEFLGSYHSLASALENLLSGHVDWPSTGLDPSKPTCPTTLRTGPSSASEQQGCLLFGSGRLLQRHRQASSPDHSPALGFEL